MATDASLTEASDGKTSLVATAERTPHRWRSLMGGGILLLAALAVAAILTLVARRSVVLTAVRVVAVEDDTRRFSFEELYDKVRAGTKDRLTEWERPDYELKVTHRKGGRVFATTDSLGVKPNESANEGLSWTLSDPISLPDVSVIELIDRDVVLSDTLVTVSGPFDQQADAGNYRFEFDTATDPAIGFASFATTSLGERLLFAIVLALVMAIILRVTA